MQPCQKVTVIDRGTREDSEGGGCDPLWWEQTAWPVGAEAKTPVTAS